MRSIFSRAGIAENMSILDDFEFFGNLIDNRKVIVADKVENRIHDGALAEAEQIRVALATLSHFGIGGRRAVSYRHDEPLANNQMGLAVLYLRALELRGSQNDKQTVVINVKLRALVRLVRVLDH